MNILELAILKKMVGGGGGSGTDNYNDLSNLPKINDTTLSGNKTSANLGLQSEINSDSKLSSDLIDDTGATNLFVTEEEKLEWSGKQDEITNANKLDADLVDDEESTNKFVTAQDKETWNAKQNAIDSTHKLSSDLVDDTNHTNKFVTSQEKETWSAKQNAIDDLSTIRSGATAGATAVQPAELNNYVPNSSLVEVVNDGAKNLIFYEGFPKTEVGVTLSFDANGGIELNGTCGGTDDYAYIYGAYAYVDAGTDYSLIDSMYAGSDQYAFVAGTEVFDNPPAFIPSVANRTAKISGKVTIVIRLTKGITYNKAKIYPMICTKSQFGISDKYEPYALGNQVITPALIEQIDAGAKNLQEGKNNTGTGGTATIQSDGCTVKLTGSATASSSLSFSVGTAPSTGTYKFVISASGTMDRISIWDNTSNVSVETLYGTGAIDVQLTGGHSYALYHFAGSAMTLNATVSFMICSVADWNVSHKIVPYRPNWDLVSSVSPFYSVPINHNMIYRGQNLGSSLTDAQHTALSSGNFTDLYLGDYWTKTVTIPAGTYTGGDGQEKTITAQTNITLKAVIADFDTFYAGYVSDRAAINTHHVAIIVTGFLFGAESDSVKYPTWNKTNSTAGGYVNSLIHKWLVGSTLPQIESWFGSTKVLSHQKVLTNAITGDAASDWAWSSQKISLLSENQIYGSKIWGGSKATNGAYDTGEAFKKLNVFNYINANMLFGNRHIWCRDITSATEAARLNSGGNASYDYASNSWISLAALILLS